MVSKSAIACSCIMLVLATICSIASTSAAAANNDGDVAAKIQPGFRRQVSDSMLKKLERMDEDSAVASERELDLENRIIEMEDERVRQQQILKDLTEKGKEYVEKDNTFDLFEKKTGKENNVFTELIKNTGLYGNEGEDEDWKAAQSHKGIKTMFETEEVKRNRAGVGATGTGTEDQRMGAATDFGVDTEGSASMGAQYQIQYVSPIEMLASCGYNVVFDVETVPLFELTMPMKQQNIVGVMVNPQSDGQVEVSGFQSVYGVLESMRQAKNLDVSADASLGGSKSGFSGSTSAGLSAKASLTQSESMNNMKRTKGKKDVRFSRISVKLITSEVLLTRANMMLSMGFLEDVKRLPIIPNSRKLREDPFDFLSNPEMSEYTREYFKFFDKYGTHYRRKSKYGGNLDFIFSSETGSLASQEEKMKQEQKCMAAAIAASFTKQKKDQGNKKMDEEIVKGASIREPVLFYRTSPKSTKYFEKSLFGGASLKDEDADISPTKARTDDPGILNILDPRVSVQRAKNILNVSLPEMEMVVEQLFGLSALYEDDSVNGMKRMERNNFNKKYEKYNDPYDDFQLYSETVRDTSAIFDLSRFARTVQDELFRKEMSKGGGLLFGDSNMSYEEKVRYLYAVYATQNVKGISRPNIIDKTYFTDFCINASGEQGMLGESTKHTGERERRSSPGKKRRQKRTLMDVLNQTRLAKKVKWKSIGTGVPALSHLHKLEKEEIVKNQQDPRRLHRRQSGGTVSGQFSASYAQCMAEASHTGSVKQAIDRIEDYDVECKGGSGCELFLWSSSIEISNLIDRINVWAMTVYNFPIYINSDATDYTRMESIFDDTVHWRYVNTTDPIKIRNVSLDKIMRQDSMKLALDAYLTMYADGVNPDSFCSHVQCSVPSFLTAYGECMCPDNACPMDLLTRAFQAGGSVNGIGNTDIGLGASTSGDTADAPCGPGQFYNEGLGKCSELLTAYQKCDGEKAYISLRHHVCVKSCSIDETVRIAKMYRACISPKDGLEEAEMSFTDFAGSEPMPGAGLFDGTVSSIMSNVGGMDGSDLSSDPKVCSTPVSFCVPLCGDGTFLLSQLSSTGLSTGSISRKCVRQCPAPMVADPKTFKCVSGCLGGMREKYDKSTGNIICVEDCGMSFELFTPTKQVCLSNNILGFYNATINTASFPGVSCAKGSVFRNRTGWLFIGDRGTVSSNEHKASTLLVTSINANDIVPSINMVLNDVLEYAKGKEDVLNSLSYCRICELVDKLRDSPFKPLFPLCVQVPVSEDTTLAQTEATLAPLISFVSSSCIGSQCFGGMPKVAYPGGDWVFNKPQFGGLSRILIIFDNTDLNYLSLDPATYELRKGRKGEAPVGFLFQGNVKGESGTLTSFLGDNDQCRPSTFFANKWSSNSSSVHSTGNFIPQLNFNNVTKTLRLYETLDNGQQTFLEFHKQDKISKPMGSCNADIKLLQNDPHFDLSLPRIYSTGREAIGFNDGFSFVTGKLYLSDLKVLYIHSGGPLQLRKMFASWPELETISLQRAYVISNANDRCFIACIVSVVECNLYCVQSFKSLGVGMVQVNQDLPLWEKKLSLNTIMKILDFRVLALMKPYKYLEDCEEDWDLDNNACVSAINRLDSVFRVADQYVKNTIEASIRTRDYVFYVPANPTSIRDIDESYAGDEAINYEAILQTYLSELEKMLNSSLYRGDVRTKIYDLRADIRSQHALLTFEPKYPKFSKACKQLLLEIVTRMNHLKDQMFSIQLIGSSGKSPVIIHLCLEGSQRVRYTQGAFALDELRRSTRSPLSLPSEKAGWEWGPIAYSSGMQRVVRERRAEIPKSSHIVDNRKAQILLNRINATESSKVHKNEVCAGDKSGYFCAMAYNYTELAVIEFTINHDGKKDYLKQVCPVYGECRSERFKLPSANNGEPNGGYLMFIFDFENSVLRFDLLVRVQYFEKRFLQYLAHVYADTDCFNGNVCYGRQKENILTLRNSGIDFPAARGIKDVHVGSIKIATNDSAYFYANPFAAYLRPCFPLDVADPTRAQSILLISYARFNYADKREYQDVMFVYLCSSVCERRILVLSMGQNNGRDEAEFESPDLSAIYNQEVEHQFSEQPQIPRKLVFRYSEDFAQDEYTLDRFAFSVNQMEYTLLNRTVYYEYLDKAERNVRSLASGQFNDLLTVIGFMRTRLLLGFEEIDLGNNTKPHIDPFEGEMFVLSSSAGDKFARLYSELKSYHKLSQAIEHIYAQPTSVVSERQKLHAQYGIVQVFNVVTNELQEMELEQDLGLRNNGTLLLTWKTLQYVSNMFKLPQLRVYSYVLVSFGTTVIQIDRKNETFQIHCSTKGGNACTRNGHQAFMIVRYESDPFSGDIRLEMQAPCTYASVKHACVSKLVHYSDIILDRHSTYSTTAEEFRVVFTPSQYAPSNNSPYRLVITSWYPPLPNQIAFLYRLMCGTYFALDTPLLNNTCKCLDEYSPLSCRCKTTLNQIEGPGKECICDKFKHFTLQSHMSDECICDRSKYFIEDENNPNMCVCNKRLHRVYDKTTQSCLCDMRNGWFQRSEYGSCEAFPLVTARIRSVRMTKCASGKCFDFDAFECKAAHSSNSCENIIDAKSADGTTLPWNGYQDAGSSHSYTSVLSDTSLGGNPDGRQSYDELLQSGYSSHPANTSIVEKEIPPKLIAYLTVVVGEKRLTPTLVEWIGKNIVIGVYDVRIPLVPSGMILNSFISKLGPHTVTEIEISKQQLPSIPKMLFAGMRNVRTLRLTESNLAILLEPAQLYGLENLKTLDLQNNKLYSIGKNALDTVNAIEQLNLGGNNLNRISARGFCLLSNLKVIFLDDRVEACLPAHIFNKESFQIQGTYGSFVRPSIDLNPKYKCTEDTVCGGVENSKCMSKGANLPKVMTCKATANDERNAESVVQMIGKAVDGILDVYANVAYNIFFDRADSFAFSAQFKGKVYPVDNFETIVVKDAFMGEIPVELFQGLYFVKKLILQDCHITHISPGVFQGMHFLTDLYIVGNNMTVLTDHTFEGLGNLTVLNLEGNRIRALEPNSLNLPSLTTLSLSGNYIEELHPGIFKSLVNLRSLKLNSNLISTFPSTIFANLASIFDINVADNKDNLLDNIFTDLPTVPKILRVGINAVVCLPPLLYSETRVYPSQDLAFCIDGNTEDSVVCPENGPMCPPNGVMCTSDSHCFSGRFKGAYSYCAPQGVCICGEYLGGPKCNIALGAVSVVVDSEIFYYYNIPLHSGSLQNIVSTKAEEIIITCPFIDNTIFNDDLFVGLTTLSKITLRTIVPLGNPIVPNDNFYSTHPNFVSDSNLVFVPKPPWLFQRPIPPTYLNNGNVTADTMRLDLLKSRMRRSTHLFLPPSSALKKTEKVESNVKKTLKYGCYKFLELIEDTCNEALKSMKPSRANDIHLVLKRLRDNTKIHPLDLDAKSDENPNQACPCGVGRQGNCPASKATIILDQFIELHQQNDGEMMADGLVYAQQDKESFNISFRIIVINSEALTQKGNSLLDRILPQGFLFDLDIIIDTASEYWPDVGIISGKQVILKAPKLTAIAPIHFSSLYHDQSEEDLDNIYLNILPSSATRVICEPKLLFGKGVRAYTKSRECFKCEFPSRCEYIVATIWKSNVESARKISYRIAHVFPIIESENELISMPELLKQYVLQTSKESLGLPEHVQGIQLAVSSCHALNLLRETQCEVLTDEDSTFFTNLTKFSILLAEAEDKSLCSIYSLDLRFLFTTPTNAKLSISLLFFTENQFYVYLNKHYLDSKSLSAEVNKFPPGSILLLDDDTDAGENGTFQSEFIKQWDTKSIKEFCHVTKIEVKLCTLGVKKCFPCEVNNYSYSCRSDTCPSYSNAAPCSGHGECEFGHCVCNNGFTGVACNVPTCAEGPPDDMPCSGSGFCDLTNSECVCPSSSTGRNCDTCSDSGDCLNEGRCVKGRCVCTSLYGGSLCQYPFVGVEYATVPYPFVLQSKVKKMLLKPFMFSSPVSADVAIRTSLQSITALKIYALPTSEYVPGYIPFSSLPPYLLFGLENLRYLDINELIDRRVSVDEISVNGRVFDTVKDLQIFFGNRVHVFGLDNIASFALRGLDMWIYMCKDRPAMCQSNLLLRNLYPLEVRSRSRGYTAVYDNIPLIDTSWYIRSDPAVIDLNTCNDIVNRWQLDASLSYNHSTTLALAKRNYYAWATNVHFVSGEVRMETVNNTKFDEIPKDCHDLLSSKGNPFDPLAILRGAGASMWSGDALPFGKFRLKISFPLSCTSFPVVWLINQDSIKSPLYMFRNEDCLGTIQLFAASTKLWLPRNSTKEHTMCQLSSDRKNIDFSGNKNILFNNMFHAAYQYAQNNESDDNRKTSWNGDSLSVCPFVEDKQRNTGANPGLSLGDSVQCEKTRFFVFNSNESTASANQTDNGMKNKRVTCDGWRITPKPESVDFQVDDDLNEPKLPSGPALITVVIEAVITQTGMAVFYEYAPALHAIPHAYGRIQSTFGPQWLQPNSNIPLENNHSKPSYRKRVMLLHADRRVPMPSGPFHLQIGVHSAFPHEKNRKDKFASMLNVKEVHHAASCIATHTILHIVLYQDISDMYDDGEPHGHFLNSIGAPGADGINKGRKGSPGSLSIWMKEYLDSEGISYEVYFSYEFEYDNAYTNARVYKPNTSPSQYSGSGSQKRQYQKCSLVFVPQTDPRGPFGLAETQTAYERLSSLQYRYRVRTPKYALSHSDPITKEDFEAALLELGIVYNASPDVEEIKRLATKPRRGLSSPCHPKQHYKSSGNA
eukprot:Nk52_evm3s216 gene=Nk52_evmTU3s216